MWTTPCARRDQRTTECGRRCPAPNGESTCSGSPADRLSRHGTRRRRDAGQRETDQRVPGRRRTHRVGPLLPRGLGRQARARRLRPASPSAGRGGPGDPVELPAPDGSLEDCSGAGRRQHRGDQPAETTPLSILVLAEIIADADLPPGVVNILPGAGDIGAHLVTHPALDKVAFTGSTEVGRQIQRSLAGTGRNSPSNSAARPRTSSSTTRRSTRPSKVSSTASSTRDTSAVPDPVCWYRNRWPTR